MSTRTHATRRTTSRATGHPPVTAAVIRYAGSRHERPRVLDTGERLLARLIGEAPLLRAEEEVELAKAVEAGVLAADRLANTDVAASDPHLAADFADLVRLGVLAQERMVRANLRLVAYWARRRINAGAAGTLSFEDLLSAGVEGLVHAVEMFDYAQGFKFSTYATGWIKARQGREVWRDLTVHVPDALAEVAHQIAAARTALEKAGVEHPSIAQLAAEAGVEVALLTDLLAATGRAVSLDSPVSAGDPDGATLGDLVVTGTAPDPADLVVDSEDRDRLRTHLSVLPERQARVLGWRLGLVDGRPRTVKATARLLGVSEPRADRGCRTDRAGRPSGRRSWALSGERRNARGVSVRWVAAGAGCAGLSGGRETTPGTNGAWGGG